MSPQTLADWIAWGGLVLPLIALSWSAVQYVRMEARRNRDARFQRFFDLMEQVGRQDYSIAAKMAAIAELKRFPEHRDVILRLCEDAAVHGAQAHLLEREFELTARHLGGNRARPVA